MLLLEIDSLSKAFGGLAALIDFNLSIEKGDLTGLIGPNGAGKTTVFNLVTGIYKPDRGRIVLDGVDITGWKPYAICGQGIARTFQNIRLFNDLTVLENVKISFHKNVSYGIFSSILRTPAYFRGEKEITRQAKNYLEIFGLNDRMYERAGSLPYGEQRRLEIARAMATSPRLLILDEPAAGMNPQETRELMELIRWLKKQFDLTVLLIEHDMSLIMGVCEKICVLDYGQVIAFGEPSEIRKNPRVIEAYLGEEVV